MGARPAARAPIALAVTLATAAAGCGLGLTDERSGGADNLPTLGAGPYRRLLPDESTPVDEPYLLGGLGQSFEDPAALARAGGGLRLWFGYTNLRADDPASEVWYAELPSLAELPVVGPRPALAADQPWEAERVAAPAVVELGDGRLALFYEAGDPDDPAIGRADSDDGGVTWRKHPGNPVLAGIGSPTVVVLDGAWTLYGTRPAAPGIFRADSADGLAWSLAPDPVIEARPGLAGAFDRFGVDDPFAVAFVSPGGQAEYGLFFHGADGPNEDSDVAVGYAGSFDGVTFERFAGPEPVLVTREVPVDGPSAVIEPTGGTLLFSEVSAGRGKIAAAVHP